jgi:hypothetical protein
VLSPQPNTSPLTHSARVWLRPQTTVATRTPRSAVDVRTPSTRRVTTTTPHSGSAPATTLCTAPQHVAPLDVLADQTAPTAADPLGYRRDVSLQAAAYTPHDPVSTLHPSPIATIMLSGCANAARPRTDVVLVLTLFQHGTHRHPLPLAHL